MLYTGDEAGYLQKWDLTQLIEKLRTNEETHPARVSAERERAQKKSSTKGNATFITSTIIEELKFGPDDIVESMPWLAH